MKKITCFLFLLCLTSRLFAGEKTYEVSEIKDIQKILDEVSCLNMMLHGEGVSHPFSSAILAGWHIGKMIVTDDDSQEFNWPFNNRAYRIKRTLQVFFYDKAPVPTLVLKTKPCGADPIWKEDPVESIWDEKK